MANKQNEDCAEIVKYRLLSTKATIPSKATPGSIGYDLYSAHNCEILPLQHTKVSTDIILVCPQGTYGRIADRSSIANNLNLHVIGGVIDPDFQGNIQVLLHNIGTQTIYIAEKMKIAQIIFEKAKTIKEFKPDLFHSIPSIRGSNGFGSSDNSSY